MCLAMAVNGIGQKRELLSDPMTIESRVIQALDNHKESDEWKEWLLTSGVKGEFVFDLTIWNKGEVVAVRALSRSEGAEIKDQNALKDYLKVMKFHFKVPKGKRYKVTCNFIID